MPQDVREQMVKHLTDVHSIEVQALDQMRVAPRLAGSPGLERIFEAHRVETEDHERRVRERLDALGESPSAVKDLAGRIGAWGMVLFAWANPDTPGKLVNHAFAYEHMELAAYELLARVARRAGDSETAALAGEIAAEERAMARRLEEHFDEAVAASLRDQDPDDMGEQLVSYLADAHAIGKQAVSLCEGGQRIAGVPALAALFEEHLSLTESHQARVEERLAAHGASPSRLKDIGLRLGGLNVGAFFAAQPDTPAKLAGFAFAFEALEVAAYEQLSRVAERAGDGETAVTARGIGAEDRAMRAAIAECWDAAVDAALEQQGVA